MDIARFKTIVKKLVKAELNDSWKYAGDPDDIPVIEAKLKAARKQYKAAIKELFPDTAKTKSQSR